MGLMLKREIKVNERCSISIPGTCEPVLAGTEHDGKHYIYFNGSTQQEDECPPNRMAFLTLLAIRAGSDIIPPTPSGDNEPIQETWTHTLSWMDNEGRDWHLFMEVSAALRNMESQRRQAQILQGVSMANPAMPPVTGAANGKPLGQG